VIPFVTIKLCFLLPSSSYKMLNLAHLRVSLTLHVLLLRASVRTVFLHGHDKHHSLLVPLSSPVLFSDSAAHSVRDQTPERYVFRMFLQSSRIFKQRACNSERCDTTTVAMKHAVLWAVVRSGSNLQTFRRNMMLPTSTSKRIFLVRSRWPYTLFKTTRRQTSKDIIVYSLVWSIFWSSLCPAQ
jgi:hypothetical protein